MHNYIRDVHGFYCICRLSRSGQPFSGIWVTKVQPWVDAWDEADENVVQPTGAHTDRWFQAYLTWYQVRTRCRVTYADNAPQPHVASSTDAYARYGDEALAGAVSHLSYYLITLN